MQHSKQAQSIYKKFGGARNLARLLGKNPSTVYRWDYPKTKGGTDGLIPSSALREVIKLAFLHGILITAEDLYPELAEGIN